ncbi:TetR/AcrR family transcriptional regulator [Pseudalkalibacillus caeni]|uniref:TetR/AcrR family transcriptional regulator n=1 Tax=Exobacillus caeni TaxID=2574798 RepID=UPI0014850E18|nr:TetR family transcriptional regulator [Pseudalkalibacillus caeni]
MSDGRLKNNRGRPLKEKEIARSALIQSATRLFSTKGFKETSLREIASDANVNMALIKYHFGSKAALWEEVISNLSWTVLQINDFELDNVEDAFEMKRLLENLFDRLVDMSFEHREFSLFIINETVQQGERFDHLFTELIQPFHDQTYPFIIKGIEMGVLADQHPEELIVMLMSSVAYQQATPHVIGKFTSVIKDEARWKEITKESLKVNFIKDPDGLDS